MWFDRDQSPKYFSKPKTRLEAHQKVRILWWNSTGVVHHNFPRPMELLQLKGYTYRIMDRMNEKLWHMQAKTGRCKGIGATLW